MLLDPRTHDIPYNLVRGIRLDGFFVGMRARHSVPRIKDAGDQRSVGGGHTVHSIAQPGNSKVKGHIKLLQGLASDTASQRLTSSMTESMPTMRSDVP